MCVMSASMNVSESEPASHGRLSAATCREISETKYAGPLRQLSDKHEVSSVGRLQTHRSTDAREIFARLTHGTHRISQCCKDSPKEYCGMGSLWSSENPLFQKAARWGRRPFDARWKRRWKLGVAGGKASSLLGQAWEHSVDNS